VKTGQLIQLIDGVLNRVLSASAKAKKVGGLFLALNGTAVKPTDAVDASNEYELVEIGGSTSGGGPFPQSDDAVVARVFYDHLNNEESG